MRLDPTDASRGEYQLHRASRAIRPGVVRSSATVISRIAPVTAGANERRCAGTPAPGAATTTSGRRAGWGSARLGRRSAIEVVVAEVMMVAAPGLDVGEEDVRRAVFRVWSGETEDRGEPAA